MSRFINGDDAIVLQLIKGRILGANVFAYCRNNSVMNSDPSGYFYVTFEKLLTLIGINPIPAVVIATAL